MIYHLLFYILNETTNSFSSANSEMLQEIFELACYNYEIAFGNNPQKKLKS